MHNHDHHVELNMELCQLTQQAPAVRMLNICIDQRIQQHKVAHLALVVHHTSQAAMLHDLSWRTPCRQLRKSSSMSYFSSTIAVLKQVHLPK